MKRNQTDFINNLGIGAFIFLAIFEFSGLFEYIFRHVLIITKLDSKLILWLPSIISFLFYTIILIWVINRLNRLIVIDTRKTLIKSIVLFCGILLIQFLYITYATDFIIDKYPKEFDSYHNARKGNHVLLANLAYISILQYLIFGLLLINKGKTVANNGSYEKP